MNYLTYPSPSDPLPCSCSPQDFWRGIQDEVDPPQLLVSLQWACVCLAVVPGANDQHHRERGKVPHMADV